MDCFAKLVALSALALATSANAATHTVNLPFSNFLATVTGSSTTVGFTGSGIPVAARASSALGGTSGWSAAANFGIGNTASGGIGIGTQGTVGVGKYPVPVQVAATASRAQLVAGVGKTVLQIGRAGAGPLGMLLLLPAFVDWMQAADVQRNPDSSNTAKPFLKTVDDINRYCQLTSAESTGYQSWMASMRITDSQSTQTVVGWLRERSGKCVWGAHIKSQWIDGPVISDRDSDYLIKSKLVVTGATTVPAAFDELTQKWILPGALMDPAQLSTQVVDEVERQRRENPGAGINPFSIDVSWDDDVKVTGPATVGSPTTTVKETTRVNPDGSKTTTTTTTTTKPKLTYTGPKANAEEETTVREEDKTCVGKTCTTVVKNPDNPDKETKPSTEETDLCKLHPDILACLKVTKAGELEATPVPDSQKTLNITPDTGWGPSGGTCPPPRTASVMGVSISMPFTMLCDFASAIKPLFIAFAWLSAALTFFGLGRKD